MSIGTANWVLTQPFSYSTSRHESKTLDAGTFVRPTELCYVPKHVKDDSRWKFFNKDTEVFCFCSQGMVPIPRSYMRKS